MNRAVETNTAVETLSPTRVKLTVEVPSAELKPYLDDALKTIASQIVVPGFRPGKVPARLIEQRIGRGAIIQDAVSEALPDLYREAITSQELRPMGQPEVDITQMPETDTEDLVFTAEVDVRPTLELPDFTSLTVEVDAVDDDAVEETAQGWLRELQERFASLTSVDRAAQDGDFVTIGLVGTIDGEQIDDVSDVSYEIGSGSMLEGLDEALTGMSVGESKDFRAPLAGGDRVGEEADITVSLSGVKVREFMDLDDDFAQQASEFDTLDELLEDLRTRAREAKVADQAIKAQENLLDLLVEQLAVPVPESLVDAEVHEHLEGEGRLEDDEHREEVTTNSRKALQRRILLETIAEKRDVQVTQPEILEHLVATSQRFGMQPNQLAQALQESDGMLSLVAEVRFQKGLLEVLREITVKDSQGETVDIERLLEREEEADAELDDDELDDGFDDVDDLDDELDEGELEADDVDVDVEEAEVEADDAAEVEDEAQPEAEDGDQPGSA